MRKQAYEEYKTAKQASEIAKDTKVIKTTKEFQEKV